MDSGYVPPDDTFEANYDFCRELKATEVIWIMDQLLCFEVAWHDGYPLSQTVFTSLHIDRLLAPDNSPPYTFMYAQDLGSVTTHQDVLLHKVLRSYCIALVKCCQSVLQLVQSQNFYEEEDFVTHLFGRDLLKATTTVDALALLDEASFALENLRLDQDVYNALECRLNYRGTFLRSIAEDTREWSHLTELMREVNRSHHLGVLVPDAFSEKVQRQLATSTPPRPMLDLSWPDSYKLCQTTCSDLEAARTLTQDEVCESPHGLQRAIWAFAYREPQPNTFARAYMQDILFGNERLTDYLTHFDLFLTDIRDLVLAGDPLADPESFQVESPSDPRYKCSRLIEGFMDKAFDEYLNLFRMVCQNRCRIRRTFTQAIPLLEVLEHEAGIVDRELQALVPPSENRNSKAPRLQPLQPLSTWTKHYKLQTVAWAIQLGFETEIYLPHELADMCFLLHRVTERRIAVMVHIEKHLQERTAKNEETYTERSTRYTAECLIAGRWLESVSTMAHVTSRLAFALWRFYSLLVTLRMIEAPKQDYAQKKLLYETRTKPYLCLKLDEIPSFELLEQSHDLGGSASTVCAGIDTTIKMVKDGLAELKQFTPEEAKCVGTEEQWKREIKRLETTCVAIAVQTSQLRRICEKKGVLESAGGTDLRGVVEVTIPAPGKRYHDWWVVPQLKERKS